MAATGRAGVIGYRPTVIIKPAADTSGPTPEQKAKARAERKANAAANKNDRSRPENR